MSSCEQNLRVAGPSTCGYTNTLLEVDGEQVVDGTDCTLLALDVEDRLLHSTTFIKLCIEQLGNVFTQGVDGYVAAVQETFITRCESGTYRSMYDYGVCCPGK